MTTVSPSPMGYSQFSSLSRRPPSRQGFKQSTYRSQPSREESVATESHARTYSLNDSSDDEIPFPMMKFSALTNALLNDVAQDSEKSLPETLRTTPEPDEQDIHKRTGSASAVRDRVSPPGSKAPSPYPRRIVRLSGTPGSSSFRRSGSLSSAVRKHNDQPVAKAESPLDLSTPAPVRRTVRIPITASSKEGLFGSSSGKGSSRADSAPRNGDGEIGSQEAQATAARSQLAASQGSVSRYGSSTIGRTRYGEDAALQNSMRVKRVGKVTGTFLRGPARRGRRRMDEDEQSPMEEQRHRLDPAMSSQDPQSQESEQAEYQSQEPELPKSSEVNRASLFSSTYRGFASGSPVSSKDILNSVLRSNSPPPPTFASSQKSSERPSSARAPLQPVQPVFRVPAPRPDLPSTHDQENEAPPTFKRNKQPPLIHLDKMEKGAPRPQSMDMDALRAASPERRPLAPRSQNTPRRPAPPPPKMSILDAATSTAGAATASTAGARRNRLKVNGKSFTRLDCIGRGGSSRVYRVMAENSKFFALKKVSLDDADEMAVRGFKGEIDLLKKLEGEDRVIRFYDYELNEDKGVLSVVSYNDPSRKTSCR